MKWLALLSALVAPMNASADAPVRLLEVRASGGAHASDYSTFETGNQAFLATRASLGVRLVGPLQVRLDGLIGHFTSDVYTGALAARVYAQMARVLVGASYAKTWLGSDIDTDMVALHAELYEADWMTVTSSFGVELKSLGDDVWFAEILLRLYPTDRLTIAPGASYATSTLKQTRADILARVEYTVLTCASCAVAVFAQYGGNRFTKASAGITVYFDSGPPAARERQAGLYGARFD